MSRNLRLLFVTFVTSFLLIACQSEPNEIAASQPDVIERAEISLPEENEEPQTSANATSALEEATTASADLKDKQIKEEVAKEAEMLQESEEAIEESTEEGPEANTTTGETIAPVIQLAIERIAALYGLDEETHTFIYDQTDAYIEVEVREKTEEGAAPMVGKYRYMFESEEVLFMDYLTGEYIPYEEAQ